MAYIYAAVRTGDRGRVLGRPPPGAIDKCLELCSARARRGEDPKRCMEECLRALR